MKLLLSVIVSILAVCSVYAQPGTYPESLKQSASCSMSAVYMMNESVHGLLIVQRIFENDNQTLNKYVDLESQKINFYGNEDLPKNVFDDPDHWFYAVSPIDWYSNIQKRCGSSASSGLSATAGSKLRETRLLLDDINKMRFTIDDELRKRDLSKVDEINAVYKTLEQAAQQCDQLLALRNQLQAALPANTSRLKPDQLELVNNLNAVYKASEQLILAVRDDKEKIVKKQLSELQTAYKNFQMKRIAMTRTAHSTGANVELNFENIAKKTETLIQEAKAYLGDSPFDSKYAAYGRNYFYYNVKMLSLFNKYGKGIVYEMNQLFLLSGISYHGFLELPHYVKIIYPEKRLEVERSVVKTETVEELPETLRSRRVVNKQRLIVADGPECVLEISDNQEVDGDIISINYNGKWIIENYPLQKEAVKLPILLNTEGKNYLLLHAENQGTIPPNTILIRYKYEGRFKRVILNSTDKESEMIEIKPNIVKKG
ncbi:MAG TPA: hypothetical protein PKU98_10355 [Saprospiraceae bacterium]|nr:hypothetical protein [Saprospiraceae bacterium]MCC6689311.1 hypothetical protein [Saprospiraceae bacterium]HMX83514.1 hypothetical protein [Saprospiraceae bacterium]HMX86577.1 hypothetical protein [Saprospiraceae bacterium]HNE66615.1 hypothetical protein [Saprospiraceae bacterium]